ncbi:MAG: pyridoxal-phosphate-dependent aminotransferase family protein [Actinomycetota bacterium]
MERPEILMTPGPTPVPHFVYEAQGAPVVYHRGPGYGKLLSEVMDGIRWLVDSAGDVLVFTASGTGGMEAAVANVTSPGDKVLVVSVGYFGERFKMMLERFGCEVTFMDYEWGKVAHADEISAELDRHPDISMVFTQHSETSTGVVNDLEAIARAVKAKNKLLVVDAISSIGATEIKMDEWGIDVLVGGSQKALGATPGIAFNVVGPGGWEAHKASKAPRFYFDWTAYKESNEKKNPESPWTPAMSVLAGLRAALRVAKDEGKESILARHRLLAASVRAGAEALGLSVMAEDPQRAVAVTPITTPEGLTDDQIVGLMRSKYGIILAPGQGPLKGKVFRIGHLGWFEPLDVIRMFGALEMTLAELGYPAKLGSAVSAAQEVLSRP